MDAWNHAKLKGKWTEVSADCRVFDALVKQQKITWIQSGRESAKKKPNCWTCLKTATNEKREGRDKDLLGDKLEAFLARK